MQALHYRYLLENEAPAIHAVLQERLELQRCAEAEFARERAMVDEVVARIQAEDRMELQSRRCKQAETKVRWQWSIKS